MTVRVHLQSETGSWSEARQDPSNIHATVKELKGAIDEIDRHINIEEDDNE